MTFGSTKCGKLHNLIMLNIIWANQRTVSFVICWLCTHAMFSITCFLTSFQAFYRYVNWFHTKKESLPSSTRWRWGILGCAAVVFGRWSWGHVGKRERPCWRVRRWWHRVVVNSGTVVMWRVFHGPGRLVVCVVVGIWQMLVHRWRCEPVGRVVADCVGGWGRWRAGVPLRYPGNSTRAWRGVGGGIRQITCEEGNQQLFQCLFLVLHVCMCWAYK